MRPESRLDINAHRFVVRRLEHALVRRDVSMLDEPMRAQTRSLAFGGVLAAIGVVALTVLAFLSPALCFPVRVLSARQRQRR